ncbi:MAG: MFS transporter [Caldiserica bacterium]|jgi:MFS family permease|nr:MFS transporter [Caldisericota bacterium]MDH7562370.1 MFS transporter [Caldisericota bacterium]
MNFFSRYKFSRNAWLFIASGVFGGLGGMIFSLLMNLYLSSIGLSKETIALVNSSLSLAEGLLAIPMAFLYDRMPRKFSLFFFTALQGVVGLFFLLTSSPLFLSLSAFLLGGTFTVFLVLTSPFLVENSSPKERTTLFSFVYALNWLMGMAGNALGGYLPTLFRNLFGLTSEPESMRWALGFAAILIGLSALPFLFLKPYEHRVPKTTPPFPGPGSPETSREPPWYKRAEGKFLLALVTLTLGSGLFVSYFNLFFQTKGFSTEAIGLTFTIGSAVTVVATSIGPFLASRLGKIGAVCVTQVLSVPFFLLLAFSSNPRILASSFVFRQAFANMGGPLQDNFAMEIVSPKRRAVFASYISSIRSLSFAFMGPIAGVVMARFGFSPLFLIAAFLYFLSAVLFWAFFHGKEREASGVTPATPKM